MPTYYRQTDAAENRFVSPLGKIGQQTASGRRIGEPRLKQTAPHEPALQSTRSRTTLPQSSMQAAMADAFTRGLGVLRAATRR